MTAAGRGASKSLPHLHYLDQIAPDDLRVRRTPAALSLSDSGALRTSLPSLGSSEVAAVVAGISRYSAAVLGALGNSYNPSAFAPAYKEHSQHERTRNIGFPGSQAGHPYNTARTQGEG